MITRSPNSKRKLLQNAKHENVINDKVDDDRRIDDIDVDDDSAMSMTIQELTSKLTAYVPRQRNDSKECENESPDPNFLVMGPWQLFSTMSMDSAVT